MRPAAFINGVIRGKSRHTEAACPKNLILILYNEKQEKIYLFLKKIIDRVTGI